MSEREIIDETGHGVMQIKCNHCNGTGKCNCIPCANLKSDNTYTSDLDFAATYLEKHPNVSFSCSKCKGYGFLLLKQDGTIIIPKA